MQRVKTGISEFDLMLNGGLLKGDAVMLAGTAGSGKTTLALQYLVNGVTQFGERGMYVTFEQLPDQIYRDASNFGWDLKKLEDENKLRIICTSPDLLLPADDGHGLLESPIKEILPHRIVIDSLSHLEMFVGQKNLRLEGYRLIMYLKAKGLSSLLLWESPQVMGQLSAITEAGLSFLVDGIVLLKPIEIESAMRKALVILKMRGTDHDKRLREYEITSQGIQLSKPFSEYEGIMSGTPTRVGTEKFVELFQNTVKRER